MGDEELGTEDINTEGKRYSVGLGISFPGDFLIKLLFVLIKVLVDLSVIFSKFF